MQKMQKRVGAQSSGSMNQPQLSAFKPIGHTSSSCSSSSSSSSSSYKSNRAESNVRPNVNAAMAALTGAHGQLNPFYIDKIFNFQNMFLFSNGANATEPHVPMMPNLPAHFHTGFQPAPTPSQDIHNIMQHNLMQNVYNYYNHSNMMSKSMKVDSGVHEQQATKIDKGNFSNERILSLPNENNLKYQKSVVQQQQQYQQSLSRSSNLAAGAHKKSKHLTKMAEISATTPMAITAPIPASMASMVSSIAYHTPKTSSNSGPSINSIKQFATKMNYKSHHHHSAAADSYASQQGTPVPKTKNAKKYKCDLCGRGFSRSNTLITHRVSFYFFSMFIVASTKKKKKKSLVDFLETEFVLVAKIISTCMEFPVSKTQI